jgi:hypothetical protein
MIVPGLTGPSIFRNLLERGSIAGSSPGITGSHDEF